MKTVFALVLLVGSFATAQIKPGHRPGHGSNHGDRSNCVTQNQVESSTGYRYIATFCTGRHAQPVMTIYNFWERAQLGVDSRQYMLADYRNSRGEAVISVISRQEYNELTSAAGQEPQRPPNRISCRVSQEIESGVNLRYEAVFCMNRYNEPEYTLYNFYERTQRGIDYRHRQYMMADYRNPSRSAVMSNISAEQYYSLKQSSR